MSAAQANTPTSAWTEPPWSGWIQTTGDALLILEAARRGLIPRVTRRLVDSERKMITSGSVFVFDEDESGIKRWTDGFYWSPSRILGNFLLYRETDKRGPGNRSSKTDSSPSDGEQNSENKNEGPLSRPKTDSGQSGVDKQMERNLMGSLTNSYKFKPDGLMKKTFSLTIGGVAQHLISYYKIEDVTNGRLRPPSSLPELASLDISPEYLDKTHFRNPPKVEVGIDGIPRYRGEADDIDTSSPPPPLSTALPALTNSRFGEARRGKRFEPYANPKRLRRQTKSSSDEAASSPSTEQRTESQSVTPIINYREPSHGMPPPTPYPTYPNFFQIPPYMPPHVLYPPGTSSPSPPAPHMYGYQPSPSVGGHPHQQSMEAVSQPYYPYPIPQAPGYPPGYANAWPPYGMYPPPIPAPLSVPQSSSANVNEEPNGNNSVHGGPETPT